METTVGFEQYRDELKQFADEEIAKQKAEDERRIAAIRAKTILPFVVQVAAGYAANPGMTEVPYKDMAVISVKLVNAILEELKISC